MTIPTQRLGDIAAHIPAAAAVFHRYGLDYCCGGSQTLEQACADRRVDVDAVLADIDRAQARDEDAVSWHDRPVDALIQHILDRYHAPLLGEISRLIELATTVEKVHGENAHCPRGLARLLTDMHLAVAEHLAKEEQILFPLIAAGRGSTAYMPVQVMMQEHDDHGVTLRRIRAITGDLHLPPQACASWTELYRALEVLERDLMDHIHLENNVLFPRILRG